VTAPWRYAAFGIFALLGLQLLWHGYLFPPTSAPVWLICAVFLLPILPAAVMAVRRHRHAPFWGAVAALLYFSHGLMEAWATPDERGPALAEAALSVWLIVAASWNGLKARFNKSKATPPAI
jgi:uncharacterized membrane protein